MGHSAKILLLKLATALMVIGTIALVVVIRSASLTPPPTPPTPASEPELRAERAERTERTAVAPPAPPSRPERKDPPAPVDPAQDAEAAVNLLAEEALDRDPSRALALLAEGDDRFPRGALADERQFLRLRAMVNLNQIPEARVEATNYLELNPRSPIARKIYRLLGIHPPPELPSR